MADKARPSKKVDKEAFRHIAARLLRESIPPRWKLYVVSLVLMAAVAGLTGALAYSTKLIVNDVFVEGSFEAAIMVSTMVVAISVALGFARYFNSLISIRFNRQIAVEYQMRGFQKLLRFDVKYFSSRNAPGQMAQLITFGRAASTIVVNLSNRIVTDLLTVASLIVVMFMQDVYMSLAACLLIPPILLIIGTLNRRIKNVAKEETELQGALFNVGSEAINGIRTVKSYGLEEKSYKKFAEAIAGLEERLMKIARSTSMTVPLMEALGGVTIGGFVIYAAWQTLVHEKSPGEFTAFLTSFLLVYQPAQRISKAFVDLQKSVIHASRLYEILDRPVETGGEGTGQLDDVEPVLEFDDVSFEHQPGMPALMHASFRTKPGERIAIVGQSGAGKTTLIDLAQGFFPPKSGTVRLGGVDLATVPKVEAFHHFALIPQEVFLFDGTIRENILDGRPDATEDEVARAAEAARVAEFTANWPDGLDTPVGPNGAALSGGQKQRIGIARALLKRAKVYVFDEATSALDGDNERAIMARISEMGYEGVFLFVTHRRSTLDWVDRVLYLEKGEIRDFGTLGELSERHAGFRSLFHIDEPAAGAEGEAPRDERAS